MKFYDSKEYWNKRAIKQYTKMFFMKRKKEEESYRIKGLFELEPFRSLIELGCAYGRTLKRIRQEYPYILLVGVDISIEMVKLAKKYMNDSNILFCVVDVAFLPFKNKCLDVSFTHGCFIHIAPPNVEQAISEANRITQKSRFVESNKRIKVTSTSYYFPHDYEKIFYKLSLKWENFFDYKDEERTRVYLIK